MLPAKPPLVIVCNDGVHKAGPGQAVPLGQLVGQDPVRNDGVSRVIAPYRVPPVKDRLVAEWCATDQLPQTLQRFSLHVGKGAVGVQHVGLAINHDAVLGEQACQLAQVRDQHVLSPQACISLDSQQSMTAASAQASKVSVAISQVMDSRTQARPNTPAWEGQGKAMAAITQLHLSRYCDEDEQQAGLCTAPTVAMINADQESTSLLAQETYADQTAVNAANDFATNLIQPVVPAAIRGDALTSVAGQDAESHRRGYNAQMSLARGVLNDIIASRAGSVQLTTAQQSQLQAEGLPASQTGSWYEATDLEVNRHLSSTDWAASLQYMPEKSVLVEVANELALGNYIAWQSYRQTQEVATVEAALLADEAQDGLKPQMSMPSPQMAAQ